eukprot:1090158-Heterocapsa_arctica.AAC.1
MMALADGRLVPHGKHVDQHRRAINAMKGRTSSSIQVKWAPSHKDEEGVKAGLISQEHMEGNKEADKLATLGVNLHIVPEALVQEVQAQYLMVKGLLTMFLDIMKDVQDKAPARKKEYKQGGAEEGQKCFH